MAEKNRPILVAIVAILTILEAIICIIAGLSLAFLDLAESIDFNAFGDILGGIGAGLIIAGIVMLIIGIGLWKGWTVIWYITLIVYVLSIIGSLAILAMALMGDAAIGGSGVISLAIGILVVYYLFRPKVKEFFGV